MCCHRDSLLIVAAGHDKQIFRSKTSLDPARKRWTSIYFEILRFIFTNVRDRKNKKIHISHSPLLLELNDSFEEKPHSRENLLGLGIPCATLICSDFQRVVPARTWPRLLCLPKKSATAATATATGTAPPYLDTPAQARRVYPVIGGLTRFASPANVPEPKLLRAGHDHLIA